MTRVDTIHPSVEHRIKDVVTSISSADVGKGVVTIFPLFPALTDNATLRSITINVSASATSCPDDSIYPSGAGVRIQLAADICPGGDVNFLSRIADSFNTAQDSDVHSRCRVLAKTTYSIVSTASSHGCVLYLNNNNQEFEWIAMSKSEGCLTLRGAPPRIYCCTVSNVPLTLSFCCRVKSTDIDNQLET